VNLARSLKVMALILSVLTLAACSSGFKRVQTWEGPDAEPSQIATLDTPEQINVLTVNGRKMGNFLLEDLALTYELLPGENSVVFTHKTIWANSSATDDEESKVNAVVSKPQKVVIDASAGESYEMVMPTPETQRQAERLAANFQATVVDSQGRKVASAATYTASKPKLPTLDKSPEQTAKIEGEPGQPAVQEERLAAQPKAAAPMNDLPTLDAMKLLWERASADDKKNFLRWAFE
jgi:uncharacterized protein YccT (UPF0319 family)